MQENKGRITSIKVIFILVFLVFIIRLFSIQILDVYGFYNNYQRYKNKKNIIPAERGFIFDRHGIALAGNKKLYKLEFCPKLIHWDKKDSLSIQDRKIVYDEITNIVSLHTDKTYQELQERIATFEEKFPYGFELVRQIDAAQKDKILLALKGQGIYGVIEYKQKSERVYPKGNLAGPLIGFYEYDNDRALCGIELVSNNELTGEDGWSEVIQYGTGDDYHFDDMPLQTPTAGKSIYLTIDAHLQAILEKNLKLGIEEYDAKGAIGIIVSPHTGEIYAMRGFNREYLDCSVRASHTFPIYPINWQYEPGSTMKPVTTLIAIEDDIYHANDLIDCRTRKIGNRTIFDVKPLEYLPFKHVLARSSNCGITRIADNIEPFKLYKTLTELGFGHKSGIILNGESAGVVRHPSKWSKYSLHSLSFGQELTITALQLAYAYAAIANGGKMLQPQIIYRIEDAEDKILFEPRPTIVRQVSNQCALDTLRAYLKMVVDEGFGIGTKLGYISIAGKTGTGEKLDPEGGYMEEGYVTSFAGFFPVEDPQVVMVIIYDEPDYDHRYGSISAVPTFRTILEEMTVLPHNDILYIANEANRDYVLVPDCIGKTVKEASQILVEHNIDFTSFGEGDLVIDQFPKPGVTMLEGSALILQAGFQVFTQNNQNPNLTH
ncbi:MAG: PASTA domain-containing protein [Candidatus Cloacimonetes bacterium]|nr:PASTA domain-containing protein [Candidatus Cloacimonadota bacterium]